MSPPKTTLWPLEPHTRAKHELLKRYLKAWFPILGSTNRGVLYVDGFCGPGRYSGGEDGSPIIALRVAASQSAYIKGEAIFWFIDEDEDRIEHLRSEIEKLSLPANFKVVTECGQFHQKFTTFLDGIDNKGLELMPTFAFIDPFGFSGIPFNLVKRLLTRRSCEVFLNFMLEFMNRFKSDSTVQAHIVEAFGSQKCIAIAGEHESGRDTLRALRDLYQDQLLTVSKYVRHFEMRDKSNKTKYLLFFATNHEKGFLKMKEAMWGIDPNGDFMFTDKTARQLVIFGKDSHSTVKLLWSLREKFVGKGIINVLEVRQYVENDTHYLKRHMIDALRQAEDNGNVKVESDKVDGTKRRAGTYPDEARISFLDPQTQLKLRL